MNDDVLAEFEPLIAAAERADAAERAARPGASPWVRSGEERLSYAPDSALLADLLRGPISQGVVSQSGRLAKAFDAWMAYELRRAAFDPAEVWPRNQSPRVSSKEVQALTERVNELIDWVAKRDAEADAKARELELADDPRAVAAAESRLAAAHRRLRNSHEKRTATYAKKLAAAAKEGKRPPKKVPPLELPERIRVQHALMPGLRAAIQGVVTGMPNVNATNILGRFYVKQVDVVVSSADRGPDVLISGKSMFSSFAKNTKNRYEETLGEATNLRDRYPLASMGYAFLVSDTILDEAGAFARLQDLLVRTRKPYGPYDATMLLMVTWNETAGTLTVTDPLTYPDPRVSGQQPSVDLSAATFFTDLLNAVIVNTPVGIHQGVRDLRNGAPVPGGTPDPAADAADRDELDGEGLFGT